MNENVNGQKPLKYTCSDVCQTIWQPVCAKQNDNLRLFRNYCEFVKQNCVVTPKYKEIKEIKICYQSKNLDKMIDQILKDETIRVF